MADPWEILDSELRRKAAASSPRYDQVTIFTTPTQRRMLFAAAKYRDLAMQSYARRAVIAFASHDLEIPWSFAMADEPFVTRFDEFGLRHRQEMAGAGFGPWVITGLEDSDGTSGPG
jgi:hypothetical protein